MKFDPIRRVLYTGTGELIKKLECRAPLAADDLSPTSADGWSQCMRCERPIVDTSCFSDEEVFSMLRADPSTCLKVDLDQANLRVVIDSA